MERNSIIRRTIDPNIIQCRTCRCGCRRGRCRRRRDIAASPTASPTAASTRRHHHDRRSIIALRTALDDIAPALSSPDNRLDRPVYLITRRLRIHRDWNEGRVQILKIRAVLGLCKGQKARNKGGGKHESRYAEPTHGAMIPRFSLEYTRHYQM